MHRCVVSCRTAALASLAIAAWRLYGPASRCETGRTCADPRVLRRRRRLLWITVAAIALLLLFPYYITWFVYEQVMNNVRLLAFLWLAGSALAAEPRTVSRSASNT